jgi:phosphatidate phosphatase APP1
MSMPTRNVFIFLGIAFGYILSSFPVYAWAGETLVPEIQIFPSIGSSRRLVIRGRVFADVSQQDRRQTPLSQNFGRLFGNREWKYAPLLVTIRGITLHAKADEEGFFAVEWKVKKPLSPQYHSVLVEVPGKASAEGSVLVVAPNQTILVSDFDDTVVITHVTSLRKMLSTAFLSTEKTHQAVPGMAQLLRCFQTGSMQRAVIFYLSGSPRQFFGRIDSFFRHNEFPIDGIMLRPIESMVHNTGRFKKKQLSALLKDFPDNKFVFIGDSGEQDPEVYAQASSMAPGRVIRTYIRLVTPEPKDSARWNSQFVFQSVLEVANDAVAQGLISQQCLEELSLSR